jgi:hypothetical protein
MFTESDRLTAPTYVLQAEERLEIYQEKLEKIRNLKDELKSHIAALPDIPQVFLAVSQKIN